MNSDIYTTRRDTLISLLTDTLNIEEIPDLHKGELKYIHKKCQEDQFEVALVGAFQGGKSTTFNALCDGRDISPRGLNGGGIKTSAGVISAQHISDPNETKDGFPEWAEVTWRDDQSMLMGMASVIQSHLFEDEEFQHQHKNAPPTKQIKPGVTAYQVANSLSLDVPYQRDAIKRALAKEWDMWEGNKGAYDQDRLELLRVAALQLHFINTPQLSKVRAKTVFGINEIQELVVFPLDWLERWTNGAQAPTQFTVEQATFAFLDRILLRVRSHNLARLGCRITDCPGLFVSEWDTKVAHEVMSRADAIWFLVGGDKSLSQEAGKIMSFIKGRNWQGKLHITVNMHGDKSFEQMERVIVPAIQNDLANKGLENIPYPYDAFLAFRSAQGRLLLNAPEALAQRDKQNLATEGRQSGEKPDYAKAWRRVVGKKCDAADLNIADDIKGDDGLSNNNIDQLYRASKLDQILLKVENMVVHLKARSILLTNGAIPAVQALERLEGDLRSKEKAAQQKVDEFHAGVKVVEGQLAEFTNEAMALTEPLGEIDRDHALFDDLWDQAIMVAADNATNSAASRIRSEVLSMGNILWKVVSFNKDELAHKASLIVSEEFSRQLQIQASNWADRLTSGENQVFQIKVSEKARTICEKIQTKWQAHLPKLNALNDEMLTGVRLPEVRGQWDEDAETLRRHLADASYTIDVPIELSNALQFNAINALIVTAVTAAIVLLTPLGWIAMIVGAILAVFAGWASGTNEDEAIRKIASELKPKMNQFLLDQKSSLKEACMGKMIAPFRLAYQAYIVGSLSEIGRVFASRKCEAEAMFQTSNEERARVAAVAHALRTEKIEPVRKSIDAFKIQVEHDFQAASKAS